MKSFDGIGLGKQDGYGFGKEGCNPKTLKECWNGKVIPTEPNALSDYLKGISL